jgi:hypothetical protein
MSGTVMKMRRFTRLTNAFSKKVKNHSLPVALNYLHHHFCRIRMTPVMAAGVAVLVWDMTDIAALIASQEASVAKHARYKKKTA